MPIKYGELTIIHNAEETDVFKNISIWMGWEPCVTNKSNLILLFDDGELCEVNDKKIDLKFNFLDCSLSKTPINFNKYNKIGKSTNYFKKAPIKKEDGTLTLDFKKIFRSYTKFDKNNSAGSLYNCIYYCHKVLETCALENPDVFSILRIKSSEIMPRFNFAYDSDEFTKEEVAYLINYIFTKE
jgi:hypothetical protein